MGKPALDSREVLFPGGIRHTGSHPWLLKQRFILQQRRAVIMALPCCQLHRPHHHGEMGPVTEGELV